MNLTFLPEGDEPPAIKPSPGVAKDEQDYLDYVRDIADEELRLRWLDVIEDPALMLDMTDGGFCWSAAELHDATRLAKTALRVRTFVDAATIPRLEQLAGVAAISKDNTKDKN